jgi:hypothetical protein
MYRVYRAELESLTWLDFVAAGGQGVVFGRAEWVVKIPRWSWQTALGRVLVHPVTPVRALGVLGGLLEPFVLLERVAFRGPVVQGGRAIPGSRRDWGARWAVAGRRHAAADFLDRRMAVATAGEAADLMDGLLHTLEAIRARGWHVLDCIMSNFVVGADGGVRLVDAGLLLPVSHLRWPSQQWSSRMFVRWMAPDYRRVLAGVANRHLGEVDGRARLAAVSDGLADRLRAWRAGRGAVDEAAARPTAAVLSSDVRERIGAALICDRRNFTLTRRLTPGYTPTHHAITSEN